MTRVTLFLLFVLFLCVGTRKLYATHAAGGELVYEKLAGTQNTYRFTFKFYRACGSGNAAAPASVKMCYDNRCGVSNQSVTMSRVSGLLPNGKQNGTPVSTGCPGYPTSCSGGSIPGYEEWWYSVDLTLASVCDYWKFWVSVSARNNAITNLTLPASRTIYIEAMFNNAVSEDNSSPYFSNVPVPYCCAGQLFSYNNGAIDADGDSLVFESVQPRTGSDNNQSCTALPVAIPYTPGAFNPVNNPFNTGNTYNLNTSTGAISFTPASVQTAVVTVKVYEYRDKLLIGYVMRDLQVIIASCNAPVPALSIDPQTVAGGVLGSAGFQVSSCAGNELRFCFDLRSSDRASILVPSDNHTVSIPGGTVDYLNTLTDSVRGCVVWTTTPQDVGLHVLTVTVRDSACRAPGLIVSHTFSLPILVNPVTVSSSTVTRTICEGQSYLGHTMPGTYTDTLVNSSGCDSIHIMELSVNPVYEHDVADSVCSGALPYRFGSQSLVSGGFFTEVFPAVTGCDSTVKLAFTVIPVTNSVFNEAICPGGSYEGYSAAGIYLDTFVNSRGCDSIRRIDLTVNPVSAVTINAGICPGQSYLGYNATGTYLDTFLNIHGCDSVRTVNLTVNPVTVSVLTATICPGDFYLGYAIAGTYIDTLVNANGCDSIRTLHLSVSPVLYETVDTALCEGQSYGGYSITGTYVDTLVSSFQCDSVRTLRLIIKPLKDTFIHMEICGGESFLGYSATGSYTDVFLSSLGCDSTRHLDLVVHPVYFRDTAVNVCEGTGFYAGGAFRSGPGIYWDSLQTASGCDSVTKTTLTMSPVLFPDLGEDRWICKGDSVRLSPGSFGHYEWSTGSASDAIYAYHEGDYAVTVYDIRGCEASDTVTVYTRDLPEVRMGSPDYEICLGDTILLDAEGAAIYKWIRMPGSWQGEGSRYAFTTPEDLEQVELVLTGTDIHGCRNTDHRVLQIVSCCGRIFLPNAFSPNGDGKNDRFGIITTAFFEDFRLMIMDRWGRLVYETGDPRKGWDGTRSGVPAAAASYYYLIRAHCYRQQDPVTLKGDVTLLR